VALQLLGQVPVLWIWDNVEPVAGFPKGTPSAWSAAEQRELVDFLRDAAQTRAKFLLTSRRDEREWLGNLPARITVPPMPMQERVQLARALAEKHGRRLTAVADWRPLLRFTDGNPLTITVLVGQALRDGLRTREQIEAFVIRLRAGEAAFDDEASEGRTKSLGAALSYGFEHAFSDTERRQLALLHFFQGFVDVNVLRLMGSPKTNWCLPELRGLTRDSSITLLDRAAEVGLLTAHGGGYYTIHPALPWYFNGLFTQFYAQTEVQTIRAFVEALGELGDYYHKKYGEGNRAVVSLLAAEEANLLHARDLARKHGWWGCVLSAMQGLYFLYDQTSRRADWKRLVDEILPDSVDSSTDGPLPEREEQWSLVTGYRVQLAIDARRWTEAERLQRATVDWDRQRAASALSMTTEKLDHIGRNPIRSPAVSLLTMGQILQEQGRAECVTAYEECAKLSQEIGDRSTEAAMAFSLGQAYQEVTAVRNLARSEYWYGHSLEICPDHDRLGRAKCNNQLGSVAYERFREARAAHKSEEELLCHLNEAASFYCQALDLLPKNAVHDLAVTHNQLGLVYGAAGNLNRALPHYRKAIEYKEAEGDLYETALTRRNVAVALARADRLVDAREYAYAALCNFQTFGDPAADEIEKTQRFIANIEKALQAQGGRP
jgi:tetratricopeptide (TPR) repeat protein